MDKFRNDIFQEELLNLKNKKYITQGEYDKVRIAHIKCFNESTKYLRKDIEKENIQINQQVNQQIDNNIQYDKEVKKPLSSQEIKEKRISLTLTLGVFLILISGCILATSVWSFIPNFVKTLILFAVSFGFFGVSIYAENKLKISKTAVAFWSLGCLFIPIAILSAGFFRLFGEWLSFYGEGRFLLGFIGSIICFIVYSYSSLKYQKRLYVWFSLASASIGICFLLSSMNLKSDVFFLGIIIYNSIIVFTYPKIKEKQNILLFVKEIPLFSQINFVISTLFVLSNYSNNFFYGINIIFAAVLYMVMIFNYKREEYHFVFTILLVYGISQMINNSSIEMLNIILYALVGYIFIGIELLVKDVSLQKKFTYTSGIVSVLMFSNGIISISQSLQQDSIYILIAFFLVTLNYIYLSYRTDNIVFNYLAPIFMLFTGKESYSLLFQNSDNSYLIIYMFSISLVMFGGLFYKNEFKYLQNMKKSGLIISLLNMVWLIICSLGKNSYSTSTILILYIFVVILLLIYYKVENILLKKLLSWSIPFTVLLPTLLVYNKINIIYKSYSFYTHFILSILIIFVIAEILDKVKNELNKNFFWAAHVVLPIVVLIHETDGVRIKQFPISIIVVMGIYLYSLYKSLTKNEDEWIIKSFLYASFIITTLTISSLLNYFSYSKINNYILYGSIIIIFIMWLFSNVEWKKRISYYLITSIVINILYLSELGNNILPNSIYVISCIGISLYILHYYNLQILNIIPILFLNNVLINIVDNVFEYDNLKTLLMYISAFSILKLLGSFTSKKLFILSKNEKNLNSIFIDWYSVFAIYYLLQVIDLRFEQAIWIEYIVPLLLIYSIFSLRNRVEKGIQKQIILTLSLLSIVVPYYKLVDDLNVPNIIATELSILPWIFIAIIISNIIFKDSYLKINRVEYIAISISSFILLQEVIMYNLFADAIILGFLALVYILIGMKVKNKFYFFAGIIVLLINVISQTEGLWQSVPWWGYLLVAGIILIITASVNEMQRNGKVSRIVQVKNNIINYFDEWN